MKIPKPKLPKAGYMKVELPDNCLYIPDGSIFMGFVTYSNIVLRIPVIKNVHIWAIPVRHLQYIYDKRKGYILNIKPYAD